MKKVSEEIEPTVRQLTAALNKSGPDATSLVLTKENLEAVNELKRVAEEYTAIHGKIIIYFEEMERIFDPKSFQGGSPSGEEIAMVQERWQEFMQSVTDLQGGLDGIHTKINAGPSAAEALRLAREGAAEAGTAVPASNPDSNRKAIMDSSDATGVPFIDFVVDFESVLNSRAWLPLTPFSLHVSRLREILLIILEKFHQLDLALLAARTRADIPELEEILVHLRVDTAHRSTDLIDVAEYAKDFRKFFIQLAESMATPAATKEIHDNLLEVSNWADITVRRFRGGEKQMKKVSEEIEPTVRQLTAALNKSGPDATSLVLTKENLEAVNEFKQVAEEYIVIHGKIIIYFEEMERIFDPRSFQGGSPSGEEIAMVQERWQEFMQSVTDLQGGLHGIHTKINAGPNVADALRLAREGAADTTGELNEGSVLSDLSDRTIYAVEGFYDDGEFKGKCSVE
ncbi:hypothetical protein AN958_01512 [Leucoagaricus sp. SymC.cos]|nr:hypothetical protein AN958_01512 [Leucoagaricus sp. SymC.cos]